MNALADHFSTRLALRCREEAERLRVFATRNTHTITNDQGFSGVVRTPEAAMAERSAARLDSLADIAEGREP